MLVVPATQHSTSRLPCLLHAIHLPCPVSCCSCSCSCCHQIDVAMDDANTQIITIKTGVEAGRLLLHWGVEGGKNYKGGWRLPDNPCRPDGTQQYKDRALQTPFRWVGGPLYKDCSAAVATSRTAGQGRARVCVAAGAAAV